MAILRVKDGSQWADIPAITGDDGVTFTPSVSAEGVISWTNDGGKTNPTPVNIKGPKGDPGDVSSVNGISPDGSGNVTIPAAVPGSIAIIVDGDTAGTAVTPGQYAYIKNNTHGLAEGLYRNKSSSAFPVSGGTADSTVFEAVPGGLGSEVAFLNGSLTDLEGRVDGHNSGSHNSIYRGKFIGSSVSSAQWTAIKNGTFDDLFVGDYWIINGVAWRIAGFNYWYNTGDTNCAKHHAVIVPDSSYVFCPMNSTNITTGAYAGSDFYTGNNSNTGKATTISFVNNTFGSEHILSHRELLTNATTNGAPSDWAWYDSTVELMNEQMVYGSRVWGNQAGAGNGYDVGIDKSQLPLFQHEPSFISNLSYWWLRSVVSASTFAYVTHNGNAYAANASDNLGIRPVFGIYQS